MFWLLGFLWALSLALLLLDRERWGYQVLIWAVVLTLFRDYLQNLLG